MYYDIFKVSWDEWGAWSSCNAACGSGKQHRSRICKHGNAGDQGCEGSTTDDQDCSEQCANNEQSRCEDHGGVPHCVCKDSGQVGYTNTPGQSQTCSVCPGATCPQFNVAVHLDFNNCGAKPNDLQDFRLTSSVKVLEGLHVNLKSVFTIDVDFVELMESTNTTVKTNLLIRLEGDSTDFRKIVFSFGHDSDLEKDIHNSKVLRIGCSKYYNPSDSDITKSDSAFSTNFPWELRSDISFALHAKFIRKETRMINGETVNQQTFHIGLFINNDDEEYFIVEFQLSLKEDFFDTFGVSSINTKFEVEDSISNDTSVANVRFPKSASFRQVLSSADNAWQMLNCFSKPLKALTNRLHDVEKTKNKMIETPLERVLMDDNQNFVFIETGRRENQAPISFVSFVRLNNEYTFLTP